LDLGKSSGDIKKMNILSDHHKTVTS